MTAVLVSEVVGVGADARRSITVGAWQLTAWEGGAEPLMRDLDLGERLGYERPRDVRKIIERLANAGKLNNIHQCAIVARRDGQVAPQPVNEFWLTEAQALKVAAKSETDPADALLDEMISVYMLAKAGLAPSVDARLDRMERMLSTLLTTHRPVGRPTTLSSSAMPPEELDAAIVKLGTTSALARACGVTYPTVHRYAVERRTITTDLADRIRLVVASPPVGPEPLVDPTDPLATKKLAAMLSAAHADPNADPAHVRRIQSELGRAGMRARWTPKPPPLTGEALRLHCAAAGKLGGRPRTVPGMSTEDFVAGIQALGGVTAARRAMSFPCSEGAIKNYTSGRSAPPKHVADALRAALAQREQPVAA